MSGTGHRPDKIGGWESQIRVGIRQRLLIYKPCLAGIVSGFAVGFDTWWAEEALTLSIPVCAAIPFPNQHERWPRHDQERYLWLLRQVKIVHYVYQDRPQNKLQAADWLNDRNVWMLQHSNALLACYNGDPTGGTANTFRLARAIQEGGAHPMAIDWMDPADPLVERTIP